MEVCISYAPEAGVKCLVLTLDLILGFRTSLILIITTSKSSLSKLNTSTSRCYFEHRKADVFPFNWTEHVIF